MSYRMAVPESRTHASLAPFGAGLGWRTGWRPGQRRTPNQAVERTGTPLPGFVSLFRHQVTGFGERPGRVPVAHLGR